MQVPDPVVKGLAEGELHHPSGWFRLGTPLCVLYLLHSPRLVRPFLESLEMETNNPALDVEAQRVDIPEDRRSGMY